MKKLRSAYNNIISKHAPTGQILGVGDSAREHAILNFPYFNNNLNTINCRGININKDHCGQYKHFTIDYGDANCMPQYNDEQFDCVLCFMMLEHNPEFWLSLNEMYRVLKRQGILIVAVPGFTHVVQSPGGDDCEDNHPVARVYGLHGDPDCYRFGSDFFKYTVFKGYQDMEVYSVSVPPRLVGVGYKK